MALRAVRSSSASLASMMGLLFTLGACAVACGGSSSTGATTSGDDASGSESGDDGGANESGDDGGAGDTNPTGDDGGGTDAPPVFDVGPADTPIDACGAASCLYDEDNDGIPDKIEGRCAATPVDTDGDGTPDYLDLDSDGDGIPDKVEWTKPGCNATAPGNDADGDLIPNFQDLDSDGNGLPDKDEVCPLPAVLAKLGVASCTPDAPLDLDGDGVYDFLDNDNDHDSSSTTLTDGLEDVIELSDATGTYVGLIDSDGDGIPDLWDRDSDNDTIADLEDGVADPDLDGLQAFRDTDSDGDKIPDKCEARGKAAPPASDLSLAVVDSDGDGKPDFLDVDSDGDLLVDGLEDLNANCVVDACETDRRKADTDGDGVSDLVETSLDTTTPKTCWASDATKSPIKAGMFYFVVPYSTDGSAAPSPTKSPLGLSTTLNKGDVGFLVDTTGSMGGTIAGLKGSLSSTIIPALKARIPDLGVGVAGHDDFPYSGYGAGGDLPFYIASSSGFVTTTVATAQAAANTLGTHNGNDGPEAQIPGMYYALTGTALTWPGGSVAAATPSAGTFGGMHFRSDALPILINLTDADFHNGKRALDKTGTSYDTAFQNTYSFPTFNADDLVAQLNALGARFIGGAADNGGRVAAAETPYAYGSYISDKTQSYAPPSAFTHGASCAAGLCCTGVNGAGVAPDGPTVGGVQQCRLIFSFSSTGTGLSSSIVDGVVAILNSIKFDVYVAAYNDPAETTDVIGNFMQKVEPNPAGGTDPVTGSVCLTFPAGQLRDNFTGPKALTKAADGVNDTIAAVNPGAYYCFDVTPKANTVVTPKPTVQLFTGWLKVNAIKPTGGTFALGTDRKVLFIVPPVAQ